MSKTERLLKPVVDTWDWQLLGLCRSRSVGQFFHPDDDLGRISRRRREAAAKRLCRDCPVRAECAAHALAMREEYGVWGGFSEAERTLLRKLGWQDTLDDAGRRVDVTTLQHRLARSGAASIGDLGAPVLQRSGR